MADKEKTATTYTIRLCKNGKEFKTLNDVLDDDLRIPRPTTVGGTIDDDGKKWRVLGVIRHTVNELVVDVEPL